MSVDGLPFRFERGGDPNVVAVTCDVPNDPVHGQWKQWFLLSTDRHQDNPDCDRDLEEKHLNEAVERRAGILDNGDLFCAMQGKYDRRADKSKLRPEHQEGRYLDALVRTAADRYEPYASHWILLAQGNHEKAIYKNHETCLIERLAQTLNDRTGSAIIAGGYTNWVVFRFRRGEQRVSKVLWMMHGYAGGGQVTQDMIQFQRQMAYLDNVDITFTGHTHDDWCTQVARKTLDRHSLVVKEREILGIKGPSYKDEYKSGQGGWHIETGKRPKPKGAYWLRFYWANGTVQVEAIRAR